MIDSEIQRLQDELRSAREAVLAAIQGVSEDDAHKIPAVDEWSVAQLLAHITEIQGFWVGKAVLITKEDDTQIPRTAVENDIRSAAVANHAQDNLADLTHAMVEACDDAVATIGNIDPKNLDRPGYREANPITAGGVIESVAQHVRDHAIQITEARESIGS